MDENKEPESVILSGKPSEIMNIESSVLTQTEDSNVPKSKSWGWFLIGLIGIPLLCGILIGIEESIVFGNDTGGPFGQEHKEGDEIYSEGILNVSGQNHTIFRSEFDIIIESDGETNSRIEYVYIEFNDEHCEGYYRNENPKDWQEVSWCNNYRSNNPENIYWRQNGTYFEFAINENISAVDGFEVTHMGVDYEPEPWIDNSLDLIQSLILLLIPVLIFGSIIWGFSRGDQMLAWGTITGVFVAPVAFFILFVIFAILAVGLDSLGIDF
ncbi:MAG: hypothetical protein CMB31_04610 [Euryarchaeota archaeon]|nr:hypothetical protein [Euryarchaeota archaeon]